MLLTDSLYEKKLFNWIKHNPKTNIFLVLNKNHRKYQFTYGIFRHVYYAIFNQCTKSKSKSVTYIHTVKSIKIN